VLALDLDRRFLRSVDSPDPDLVTRFGANLFGSFKCWAVRQAVLLRGINLGSRNRIAMPDLRQALSGAGFEEVRTYLQSGNVVLSSDAPPTQLAAECERLIQQRFGLDVRVLVRTRKELAAVVRRNPLRQVAVNFKRYQVTFLSEQLDSAELEKLAALAASSERFVAIGRELYAWHPEGIGRSRLWARLASKSLSVVATARNWATVTQLLEMASE
jgi:uncharacterized protein (DUF1697 family)